MLIYEAINTVGNKEIYDCYQFLIEDIFSTDKETNWNLFSTSNSPSNEFNSLYSFLNADGDLFNLIKFLMGDSSLKYFFPVAKLSVSSVRFDRVRRSQTFNFFSYFLPLQKQIPSKMLIEQGITPNFYLNKVHSDSMSIHPTKIQLNPFEFFFFHFTNYIKNLNTILEFGNNEQINILYLNLLESYLVKFLPTNNNKCLAELNTSNTQNSLWQSLSSTTSNLLHLGQQSSTSKTLSNQDSTSLIQKPSLLNIKPLQNYSFKQMEDNLYNQKSFDSVGSVVYKCEAIINILTEMWLNIKIPTNLISKTKGANSTSLITNNCPNVVYMMCVRIFIKRAHYFTNSQTDKSLEMGNMPAFENHELDEIKKSVWTSSKYQIPKRFYNFIKLSFEHWPCDSSFRVPLETWLSYLQPWRYLNEFQAIASTSLNNSANQPQLTNLNKWKTFIQENILFYTAIYKDILSRFINLDLLSLKNANMLFRITKVFCQLNLCDLIREAESNCDTVVSNSWLTSASLRGSLLSPNLRNNSQSICNKDLSFTNLLEDNEKTGFVYVSFFSEDVKKSVIKLIGKIKATIDKVERCEISARQKTTREKNQITELFTSFFNSSNPFDLEEKQNLEEMAKVRSLLETVRTRLAQLYEIDLNEIVVNEDAFDIMNSGGDRVDTLDANYDQSTLNKEPALNLFTLHKVEYNGNPDLQPVRTFEFYYLVFLFIYLSDLINGYYHDAFKRFFESDGLVGWLARLVLTAPHEYTVIEKNGIQTQKRISKKLPPRLNLRFLASKAFYAYLFLFYVFIKLFLFSKTLLMVILFTSVLGALMVKLLMILNVSI